MRKRAESQHSAAVVDLPALSNGSVDAPERRASHFRKEVRRGSSQDFRQDSFIKIGKRRKVWVMRWREDVLLDRRHRWPQCSGRCYSGPVADLPTRRDAQAKMEERLRPVNQGTGRPEASMTFGAFVEQQWKVLALPNFKRIHAARLQDRAQAPRAARVAEDAAARHRPARHSAMGRREVPARRRLADGSEFVGAALEHPRIGGRIRLSAGEPGAGREVPAKGAEEEAEADRRRRFRASCSKHLNEPHRTMVSLIAATGLRDRRVVGAALGRAELGGRVAGGAGVGLTRASSRRRRRSGRCGRFRWGRMPSRRWSRIVTGWRGRGRADLVFGNRKGEPLRESKVLTKVLQPAAVDAGLGRVTWHQFRHIHSSLLNDLNVPVEDRAGAAWARQHFDHAGHLHARDSGVASRGGRSGRRAIVRAIALECSRIRERACSGKPVSDSVN